MPPTWRLQCAKSLPAILLEDWHRFNSCCSLSKFHSHLSAQNSAPYVARTSASGDAPLDKWHWGTFMIHDHLWIFMAFPSNYWKYIQSSTVLKQKSTNEGQAPWPFLAQWFSVSSDQEEDRGCSGKCNHQIWKDMDPSSGHYHIRHLHWLNHQSTGKTMLMKDLRGPLKSHSHWSHPTLITHPKTVKQTEFSKHRGSFENIQHG